MESSLMLYIDNDSRGADHFSSLARIIARISSWRSKRRRICCKSFSACAIRLFASTAVKMLTK